METMMIESVTNATDIADVIDLHDKPEAWKTWGVGLAIVTVSAFAAPVGILLVPLLSNRFYERVMSFLVALGIGALSGSILFIMLPQAFGVADDDGEYTTKSWIVLGALYGFFCVDRVLQYVMEARRRYKARRVRKSEESIPSTDSSSCSSKKGILPEADEDKKNDVSSQIQAELEMSSISSAITRTFSSRRRLPVGLQNDDACSLSRRSSQRCSTRSSQRCPSRCEAPNSNTLQVPSITAVYTPKTSITLQSPPIIVEEGSSTQPETFSVSVAVVENIEVPAEEIQIATVAYMILFGSSANNFVDGMSNGVAFADSLVRGLSIGIACIAQQFPQELGTLAILVKAGLGFKRTLLLNLIPGALSYIGFTVGALLDSFNEGADTIVFSISSGMYLYVFLGTLIPEVRDASKELIKTDIKESIFASVLQAIGISVGVTFMYLMAVYARRIQF